MGKIASFKNVIQRHIQGKKHNLATLPGHWFKPRKYGLEGGEVMQNLQKDLRKVLKNRKVFEYIKKLQEQGIESPTPDDIVANFSDEELQEYFDALGDMGKQKTAGLYRNALLYGIGDHSFADDEGNLCEVDEELVNILCESQDVVNEMVPIVMEHNRPLAERTPKKSET